MAGSIYRKYMWLVRSIGQSREGLTFNEINNRWTRSSLNDTGEPLSRRTFRNWLLAVGDTLGIDIACNRRAPFRYYVSNSGDLGDGLMQWAMRAFSIGQIAADSSDIKDRILLEDIPSADEWLETILSAIRNNHRISMAYKPFGRDAMSFVTEPYAVKLSRKRWYVVCHNQKNGKEYIFALDRIVSVAETDETFAVRPGYSAARDFDGCIGISAFEGVEIADVRLKITGYLRDYIDTLPIHQSQTLVEKTADHNIYQYRLRPDRELADTICGMGSCCEVLAPPQLRSQIRQCALEMAEKNK